jgi:autotransporter-associated beta strand protein
MKIKLLPSTHWYACLILLALLLGAALSADAATATWNLAGGGTWNATASWSPATIPDVNSATVVFSKDFATTAPAFTLDRNTAFTVNSVSYTDTTTPFLAGTISVGSGTGSPGLIFAGTTPSGIVGASSTLTISAPVDLSAAGLIKSGTGKLVLSGTVTGFGSSVYTNVTAGTLEISTLNVDWTTVNKTAGAGTLLLDTLSTMTVPATFSVGAGALNLNPASGTFAHDASGFTKTGNGNLIFSKAATGASALSVNAGVLNYAAGFSGFTSATVASGATLQVQTTTTLPTLTLNGNGSANTLEFPSGNSTTYTLSGITISGDVIIRSFGLVDTLTFPSAITSSGANNLTFKSEGGNTANQPWTFNLNAASSYTGNTTLNALTQQGILKLGINNALPITTTLTLNGGANANTSANLDLNGKSQTLAGLNGTPSSGGSIVYATTAGTLTISNTSNYTFSGVIGLSGKAGVSLTKAGAGTQTLSGANIYTGVTTINGGILNAGVAQVGSTSGPLGASGNIIFGGGTLQFSAASAAWDPSARIAAGTSAGAISIDPNGQAVTFATALTSSQSGGLTLTNSTGTGSLTLSTANSYTGNTIINAGKLILGAGGALPSSSSVNIAAGATFDVSAIGTYTWSGSANLTASGSASAAAILKGGTTVDVSGRSLALNFTPSGISGDSAHPALNVSAGTLNLASTTIAVTNNYASALDVGDYTLISGTVTGTPTTTAVTVGGNGLVSGASATLDASSGQLVMHVTSSATVTTTTLTRTAGGSPSTYGDSLTFHAVLSPDPGDGTTITFKTNGVAFGTATTTSGVADLTLSTLPYSGGSTWTVNAIFAGNPSFSASSGTLSGGQQVNQYALTLTGATAQSKIFDSSTAATITGGTLSSTVNSDVIGTNATFASAAVGNGKTVTVTLTGAAAANYSLTLVSPSSLTASIFANPTWVNTAGGAWDTATNWASSTIGTGSGVTADFSQLNLTADTTVSLITPRTIGTLIFGDTDTNSAASWIVDNNSTPANTLTVTNVTVSALGGTRTATISAAVAGTTLTKAGAGTLVLSGTNTYTGGTTILASAGALRLANSQAAGSGAIAIGSGGNADLARLELTGGITVANSLTSWPSRNTPAGFIYSAPNILNVSGTNQINSNITAGSGGGQSTLQSDSGSLVLLGTIGTRQLNLIGAGGGELRGVVQLQTGNNLLKDGTGAWTLLGTNTYTGNTIISNGTLNVGGAGQLGSGTYAGNIINNAAFNYASTANQTLSGIISGTGSLTNSGTGTLILSGTNTYTGPTLIQAGTLLVNGSLGTNTVTVSSNATLVGNGLILGAVSVLDGGILTPGTASLGTLTVSNTLTLAATSTNIFRLNATTTNSDAISGLTTVSYGGTLIVSNINGTLAPGQSYKLYSAASYGVSNFASIQLPALTSGMAWTNQLAVDGTIAVIATATVATNPVPITFSVAGSSLNLSWPPDHLGWTLQAQTNALTVGLGTNWASVAGSSSVTNLSIPMDSQNGSVFYRLVY